MKKILDYKNIYYLIVTLIAFSYKLPSFALDFPESIDHFDPNFGTQLSQVETETLTEVVQDSDLYLDLTGHKGTMKFSQSNLERETKVKQPTQPTDKKEGWSEWRLWTNFPHNQIQLGVSNSDYGAMMDMEYKCFNQVGADNDEKKSQTYWYRISEPTDSSEYIQIEIGCWLENNFKAISLVNGLKINNQSSSAKFAAKLYTQQIKNCPREFTDWDLIKTFETTSYSLALCQQGNSVYLVGHEKEEHEAFITANVISQNNDLIIAQDKYGFSFEIGNNQLKVTQNNQLIAQENLLYSDIKQDTYQSNLTGVVWQLQEIRYNNDQLIEVDNPSNYTKDETENTKTSSRIGSPDAVENQLQEDAQVNPLFELKFLQPYRDFKAKLKENIGLDFGFDYTAVWLGSTDSLAKDDGSGGMFRFYGSWDLVGRESGNTGAFVWKGSNRHSYGTTPPSALAFQTGYVGVFAAPFSDQGWRMTNLYWRQRFQNPRITIIGGLLDSTDYVDVFALGSPWTGFTNFAFSTGSTAIDLPNDAALGVAAAGMITDNLYMIGGLVDANSDPTAPFETFDTFFSDNEYFKSIEIGWTTSQDRIYLDNAHLTFWHIDEREAKGIPDGWGLNFSFSYFINDTWMPFVRAGFTEDSGSLLQKSISTGVAYQPPAQHGRNLLGFGFNWGQPNEASFGKGLDDQYALEIFYRIQLTKELAITPDVQLIFNPALNPQDDSMWVFGVRARLAL